jgi:hypothetical protein
MTRRPSTFRHADVSRAVEAAQTAGLTIGKVNVAPDGTIRVAAILDWKSRGCGSTNCTRREGKFPTELPTARMWSGNVLTKSPENPEISMAGAAGIEPATYGFGVPCSSLKRLMNSSNRSIFLHNRINGLWATSQLSQATIHALDQQS